MSPGPVLESFGLYPLLSAAVKKLKSLKKSNQGIKGFRAKNATQMANQTKLVSLSLIAQSSSILEAFGVRNFKFSKKSRKNHFRTWSLKFWKIHVKFLRLSVFKIPLGFFGIPRIRDYSLSRLPSPIRYFLITGFSSPDSGFLSRVLNSKDSWVFEFRNFHSRDSGLYSGYTADTLSDTGEDSKLVHRRKRPKVDTLFSSLFFDASARRVWLSAWSKIHCTLWLIFAFIG